METIELLETETDGNVFSTKSADLKIESIDQFSLRLPKLSEAVKRSVDIELLMQYKKGSEDEVPLLRRQRSDYLVEVRKKNFFSFSWETFLPKVRFIR